jgi:hypothetical protein
MSRQTHLTNFFSVSRRRQPDQHPSKRRKVCVDAEDVQVGKPGVDVVERPLLSQKEQSAPSTPSCVPEKPANVEKASGHDEVKVQPSPVSTPAAELSTAKPASASHATDIVEKADEEKVDDSATAVESRVTAALDDHQTVAIAEPPLSSSSRAPPKTPAEKVQTSRANLRGHKRDSLGQAAFFEASATPKPREDEDTEPQNQVMFTFLVRLPLA